jgi:hypothetical protein
LPLEPTPAGIPVPGDVVDHQFEAFFPRPFGGSAANAANWLLYDLLARARRAHRLLGAAPCGRYRYE